MDLAGAHLLLAGPVRYGDAELLRARAYVERLQKAGRRLTWCRICKGDGVVPDSVVPRCEVLCECIAEEPREVLKDLGVSVRPWRPAAKLRAGRTR
jgi:hypothetical protein